MTSPPHFLAAFDSASVMSMATAAALRGEGFPALGNPPALKPIARHSNLLPAAVREQVFILSGASETLDPDRVDDIDPEEVAGWLDEIYPPNPRPVVAVGSSNGALVHLYAALAIPWLPQTLLVPVDQKVDPDDPTEAMRRGTEPGRRMMDAFDDLQLHHMHDANQDRLMVRALTYFRVKRRRLGPGYEAFLRKRLEPGGTILVIDCGQRWGTTRVGERHVFQHGAVGGATEDEFHHGGPRVARLLEEMGVPKRRWDGPQPDDDSPEAEWGFELSLEDDIRRFADDHGYRVRRLSFDEPEDPSPVVAEFYREWYAQRRIPTNRLVISSFVLMDPYWTLRTASIPYWMEFNMRPSLEGLHAYLDRVDDVDELFLMLFQNGIEGVGMPDADEWRKLLARANRRGETLGADLDEYPRDFAHFARYDDALRHAVRARHPLPAPRTLDDFARFVERSPEGHRVRLED